MGSLLKLSTIITSTWLLLLGETYVFFVVIRPLAPNIHESVESAILKIGATLALIGLWVGVMLALERYYVRSVTRRPDAPTTTP